MTGPALLGWSEIYERLTRRPDRPDPQAWASLELRVRAWTPDDDLVAATNIKYCNLVTVLPEQGRRIQSAQRCIGLSEFFLLGIKLQKIRMREQ